MARERAQAEAAYAAQVRAEAEYKAALPFLLEAQRQQFERMSALERNAALWRRDVPAAVRAAGANAGAVCEHGVSELRQWPVVSGQWSEGRG